MGKSCEDCKFWDIEADFSITDQPEGFGRCPEIQKSLSVDVEQVELKIQPKVDYIFTNKNFWCSLFDGSLENIHLSDLKEVTDRLSQLSRNIARAIPKSKDTGDYNLFSLMLNVSDEISEISFLLKKKINT